MFLNSKINLLSGLAAVLVLGFSSCTEVPIDTEQVVNHKVLNEYKSNFIAKYGQPAANQSWDFSDRAVMGNDDVLPCIEEPSTRAISTAAEVTSEWYEADSRIHNYVLKHITTENEINYIRENLAAVEEKDWAPNIFGVHDFWVWFVHGNGDPYTTYSIGIHSCEPWTPNIRSGSHPTEYFSGIPLQGSAINSGWYAGYGYSGPGYRIDSRAFENSFNDEFPDWVIENEDWSYFYPGLPKDWDYETGLASEREFFWYAMTDDPTFVFTSNDYGPDDWTELKEQYELKKYKEIETPLGAIYWCFDCDHNGDYSDLVCLVEPTTVKRYLIEDLGSLDDFDFNDIVVDVASYQRMDQETGEVSTHQKAIVRAMGGTLDFTLTIGNTTWSKSGKGFDAATVYNAYDGEINYNATLAEFEVTGWVPNENNISVTVTLMSGNQRNGDDVAITYPFPKAGEVPMIMSLLPSQYLGESTDNPRRYWMPERVSIPAKYFTQE